jgi:hypothetical protein
MVRIKKVIPVPRFTLFYNYWILYAFYFMEILLFVFLYKFLQN